MEISPVVSIIIPHLNQNSALEKCIFSLEEQSYPASCIEIVIVDNGSKILPAYRKTVFKSHAILTESTPGPGPARNTGVAFSEADILFFIDADCTADPDWIKNGVASLLGNPAAILGGDVKITKSSSTHMTAIEAYENIFAYQQETYIKKMGFSGSGNLAIGRENFTKVGPFPGIEVAEDRSWGAQALKAGFKFTYCPEMIIYHPPRKYFHEMFDKWARHLRHDFADLEGQSWVLMRWSLRSLLVFLSIPVHTIKVISSNRLSGMKPKSKAIIALVIIRLFRVGFMLRMSFSKKFRNQDLFWNRE